MSQIALRAISPDNRLEIEQLIDLFRRVYSNDYPIKNVYDAKFWSTHLGVRYTGLVLVNQEDKESRFEGFVAFGSDSSSLSLANPVVQFAYPVISSKLENLNNVEVIKGDTRQDKLGLQISSLIQNLAQRQNWRALYSLVFSKYSPHLFIDQPLLDSAAVMLCPAYLPDPASTSKHQRLNVLVTQRYLNSGSLSCFAPDLENSQELQDRELQDQADKRSSHGLNPLELDIYVPARHIEICKIIYKGVGIVRNFASKPNAQKQRKLFRADARAIELRSYQQTDVCNIMLHPSLLSSFQYGLAELKRQRAQAQFVFVDLEDPLCPDFSELLESNSYRFIGIAPLLEGRDSIVYWRESDANFDDAVSASSQASMLAKYIQNYDLVPSDSDKSLLSKTSTKRNQGSARVRDL